MPQCRPSPSCFKTTKPSALPASHLATVRPPRPIKPSATPCPPHGTRVAGRLFPRSAIAVMRKRSSPWPNWRATRMLPWRKLPSGRSARLPPNRQPRRSPHCARKPTPPANARSPMRHSAAPRNSPSPARAKPPPEFTKHWSQRRNPPMSDAVRSMRSRGWTRTAASNAFCKRCTAAMPC